MKNNPYPLCISCKKNPATKYDGDCCGITHDKNGKPAPGYIVWLCDNCDAGNNHFSLPTTFKAAAEELVYLRKALQEIHNKYILEFYSKK